MLSIPIVWPRHGAGPARSWECRQGGEPRSRPRRPAESVSGRQASAATSGCAPGLEDCDDSPDGRVGHECWADPGAVTEATTQVRAAPCNLVMGLHRHGRPSPLRASRLKSWRRPCLFAGSVLSALLIGPQSLHRCACMHGLGGVQAIVILPSMFASLRCLSLLMG